MKSNSVIVSVIEISKNFLKYRKRFLIYRKNLTSYNIITFSSLFSKENIIYRSSRYIKINIYRISEFFCYSVITGFLEVNKWKIRQSGTWRNRKRGF